MQLFPQTPGTKIYREKPSLKDCSVNLPRPYSVKWIALAAIIEALRNLKPSVPLPGTYRNHADRSPPSQLEEKEKKITEFWGKKDKVCKAGKRDHITTPKLSLHFINHPFMSPRVIKRHPGVAPLHLVGHHKWDGAMRLVMQSQW